MLLLTSLVLGAWAYDEASSDAMKSWERRHPPGTKVWEHALGSRSLGAPGRRSRGAQAARILPVRLEPEGTAWISGDGGWVAVFSAPEVDPPYRIYCRDCDTAPASWDPAGRGWDALERVLARIDQTAKPPVASRRLQKPQNRQDPREILY
jgi:hypothetical protein